MNKNNGNQATEEVLSGDSKNKRKNGQNPMEFWQADFGPIPNSDIDKILDMPPVTDMAGVLARGNFKNDDERIRYLRVIRRLEKFDLTKGLEFIRGCIASKLGMLAFGKTLQLQAKVELIAPAVIREQLSMKQLKVKEENVRGSDFRRDTENEGEKRE